MSVEITVVHDVVCPWCRIGHTRLQAALAELTEDPQTAAWALQVRWRYVPFLLEPNAPPQGRPLRAVLSRKYGAARVEQMFARVAAIGRGDGIAFAWDRVDIAPDSTLAHALVESAPAPARGRVLDALHAAYFERGENIGELDVLLAVARSVGLDADVVRDALMAPDVRERIHEAARFGPQRGVTGVPHVLIRCLDGDRAAQPMQGAQPVAAYRAALASCLSPAAGGARP